MQTSSGSGSSEQGCGCLPTHTAPGPEARVQGPRDVQFHRLDTSDDEDTGGLRGRDPVALTMERIQGMDLTRLGAEKEVGRVALESFLEAHGLGAVLENRVSGLNQNRLTPPEGTSLAVQGKGGSKPVHFQGKGRVSRVVQKLESPLPPDVQAHFASQDVQVNRAQGYPRLSG